MSIAVMARVPFAIKKADSWLEKLGFLAIGLGLWTFNYLLAVDTAGQWRDAVTSPAALTASKAAALNSRITAAQTAADDLRKLPQASAAQIATAEQAVQIAQAAVTQECGKVGPNCRARQKELNDKIDDKAKLLPARANSEKLERYEREIKTAQDDLDALGPIPKAVDPWAERVAKVIGLIYDLGEHGDLKVIEWWPNWMAFIIEVIAMWGPRIILAGSEPKTSGAKIEWRLPVWWRKEKAPSVEAPKPVETPVEAPAAPLAVPAVAVEPAAVKPTAATAATPKKYSKIKPAAVGDANSVRQWKECRTVARPSSKVKPRKTYDNGYVAWCKDEGIEPVSFTKFGLIMKNELGVRYDDRNNRGFYLDIALISTPRLVVTSSA
jgi:hypothetical protein